MGVGGESHAPAALPPGKNRYPFYGRLGGPKHIMHLTVAMISKSTLSCLNNKLQLICVACGLCGKYYGKFHLRYK
jgi:hypothetical protein